MLGKIQLIELLKKDVVPALGCTEPVCAAFCAANAANVIDGELIKIEMEVSRGIYKNGMSAGIPNCQEVGLDYAAVLGALLKNPEKKLELLEDITPEILKKAEELILAGCVNVSLNTEASGVYAKCRIYTENGTAECMIQSAHTNVVYLKRNEEVLFEKEEQQTAAGEDEVILSLMQMKIAEIRQLVDTMNKEELMFMLDGVEMNEQLAAYSESHKVGVGVADAFRNESSRKMLSDDLIGRVIKKVSSAAESRLDGCPLPTMSSSGAGTKGLVVILPVSEAAEVLGATVEQKVRALALAHLVNRYVNAYIGKLSPMCSCVMSSSTAAAVGITYLLGGTDEQIGYAVRNMAGTVTGMICDGGKVGCSLKVATGSVAAVMSAITAVHDAPLRCSDGICGETAEESICNMAQIGLKGMTNVDKEILKIMEK